MKRTIFKPKTKFYLLLLVALFCYPFIASAQLQYITTIPPYNGGNASALTTFNVKALKTIRISEMHCSFNNSNSQTTIIWYKTDSINGTPSVSTASGWIQACTYVHTPVASGYGTMSLASDTSLNILIPQGAVYGFAISSGSIAYTGTGTTNPSPPLIADSNLYINTACGVGWGGTLTSPINCRAFNGKIGYQVVNMAADAGLTAFQGPSDTMCDGLQPVVVELKNFGSNTLMEVDINWSVNNVPQPPFSWAGNLSANGTTQVQLGTYQFNTGTTYAVKAYTTMPNSINDTINNLNDTILLTGIYVKPSPKATLVDTTFNICGGDTAQVGINLTGTPPWNIVLKDGTTNINFNNITTPSYTALLSPSSTKQYTLSIVLDVTGCATNYSKNIHVLVNPAPPAVINATGGSAKCEGDSVTLMASVGLNFTYEWFKDGVKIPGAANYVFAAKESGNYTVVVTNPIGCKNVSDPFLVTIHPAPKVNLGNDTALYPDKSIKLDAGSGYTSYVWSTGG